MGYLHLDRETDVVGILGDKGLYPVLIEELAVVLVVGIVKHFEDYLGACALFVGFGYCVTVNAL